MSDLESGAARITNLPVVTKSTDWKFANAAIFGFLYTTLSVGMAFYNKALFRVGFALPVSVTVVQNIGVLTLILFIALLKQIRSSEVVSR